LAIGMLVAPVAAAPSCTMTASAAEVCRYSVSTDYDVHVAVTTNVTESDGGRAATDLTGQPKLAMTNASEHSRRSCDRAPLTDQDWPEADRPLYGSTTLVAIRVGDVQRVVVVAPRYLAQHPVIEEPADLAKHQVVAMTHFGLDSWSFGNRWRRT
jgi:hypothetical protein